MTHIIAAYSTRLNDGTETVPDETYNVSSSEAEALVYRGHARLAPPVVEETENNQPRTRRNH